jgi:hypothetical protein
MRSVVYPLIEAHSDLGLGSAFQPVLRHDHQIEMEPDQVTKPVFSRVNSLSHAYQTVADFKGWPRLFGVGS